MKLADVASRLTECSFDLRGTKLLLLKNRASMKLRHLGIGVPDVFDEITALVHIQSHLRGRRTGVNRENPEFTGRQRSPPGRWSSPCHPHSPRVMESGSGLSRRPPHARTASHPGTSRIFREGYPPRCSEPPYSRRDLPPDARFPSPAPPTPEVRNRGQAGRRPLRRRTGRLRPSR